MTHTMIGENCEHCGTPTCEAEAPVVDSNTEITPSVESTESEVDTKTATDEETVTPQGEDTTQ